MQHTKSKHESLLGNSFRIFFSGFQLIFNKRNDSSPSVSTLLSPLMKSSLVGVRGVCMNISYVLLGQKSQIDISIKPENMKPEHVWSVKSVRESNPWKSGQIFLGLVSLFRVG